MGLDRSRFHHIGQTNTESADYERIRLPRSTTRFDRPDERNRLAPDSLGRA